MLVTERSVSNFGSACRSTVGKFLQFKLLRGGCATLAIEHDQPRPRRRRAHLPQQRHELAPMIARMVDRVTQHLAEAVHVLTAGTRAYRHGLVQTPLAQPREERGALGFDCLPEIGRASCRERV